MKSKASRSSTGKSGDCGIFKASLIGAGVGIGFAVILLLACSLAALCCADPDSLTAPLGFISALLVYFISGFTACKLKRAALPCGLLSGALVTVIFTAVSLALDSSFASDTPLPVSLLIRLSMLAVSLLGALLGVNTVKGTRHRSRRRQS